MITALLHKHFVFFSCMAIGFPIGILLLTWFLFITSYLKPMTRIHGYAAVFLFSTLGLIFKIKNWNLKFRLVIQYDYFHRWAVILCTFFLVVIVYASMLAADRYSKGAAYSDLPFHLNIITSFAYGPNYKRPGFFTADSTFYHGVNLAYPLMPDFLSAALITTGDASLQQSLFIPSLLMMYSVLLSLYTLSTYYTNESIIGCLSILIFICLGGLGFIMYTDPTWKAPEDEIVDMVHNWPNAIDGYWFHSIMHYLIPQRSALFGVPLCYWTILLLIFGVKNESYKFMFIAAILTGLTPQVQAHAYMSMAQWSIAYCITTFPYLKPKKYLKFFLLWSLFGLLANAIALPQIPPFISRIKNTNKSFMTFNPIWQNFGDGFRGFFRNWWLSLGTFGFCALIGGFATATVEQIIIYIPSLVVFFVSNIIKYQEWDHDNIKVFYNGWIPIAVPFAAQYIYSFFVKAKKGEKAKLNMFIFFALLVSSLASGAFCFFVYLASPSEIYTEQQVKFGKWITENTGPYDYFIGDQSTEQPVASIGGRPIVVGYPGWIASHGLDLHTRDFLVDTLLSHPEDASAFDKEGIKYIYMSGTSKVPFEPDVDSDVWQIVYEDINVTLYRRI